MKELVIGSRGSRLALCQARQVAHDLRRLRPRLEVRIERVKTTGDHLGRESLARLAGETKGLFVKEIEEALLQERIDLAVHSLKDLPGQLPDGLILAACPAREDARDAFVGRWPDTAWEALPEGARVGTGSLRRRVELARLRPDLVVIPLRGNVDTRLAKMEGQHLAGVVLAAAGLLRLGLGTRIAHRFQPHEMVPAIGQGALGLETRRGDAVASLVKNLEDPVTRRCVEAERLFLARMGGGCQLPMGAHAWIEGQEALFLAFVAHPTQFHSVRHLGRGSLEDLPRLAQEAASNLLSRGAREMLAALT